MEKHKELDSNSTNVRGLSVNEYQNILIYIRLNHSRPHMRDANIRYIKDIDASFDLQSEQYYKIKLRAPEEIVFTNANRKKGKATHDNLYDEIMDFLQGSC